MIKISTRHNFIYVLFTIASTNVRRLVRMFIGAIFGLSNTIFFTTIMFIGEMFTGIIIEQYHKKILPKNKKISVPDSLLIKRKKGKIQTHIDSKLKIYSLFFMLGFLDFFEFTISVFYIAKFHDISGSLDSRLCGIVIYFSAIFHYYVLRFKILRHQLFSLLIIGVCLILVIISEIVIKIDDVLLSAGDFIILVFLFLLELFSIALILAGEQYLMEFDSLAPHELLIYEGLFGLIFSFIGFVNDTPIEKLQKVYNDSSYVSFSLFIFLCFLYVILSGIFNIYRLHVNKLYSPMAVTLSNYCLNPLFMIYDFASGGDYIVKGEKSVLYFIINFILSTIIAFCGGIFNDLLVLNCCGLEYETYEKISERSSVSESIKLTELNTFPEDDEIENADKIDTYKIYV